MPGLLVIYSVTTTAKDLIGMASCVASYQVVSLLILIVQTKGFNRNCFYSCEAGGCPCNCYRDEIQCSGTNITVVPRYPEHLNIHMLDLEGNKIEDMSERDFQQKCLKNLVGLRLSANRIEKLRARTFSSIPYLETMLLNHNRISTISELAFKGMRSLKKLYLNNNKIKTFSSDTFHPFKKSLELLYLHGNSIEHIPKEVLSKFKRLRTVDLSGNKLTRIDGRIFDTIPSLQHIFMHRNPWSCDPWTLCSMFGRWTKRQEKQDSLGGNYQRRWKKSQFHTISIRGGAKCATPFELMGESAVALVDKMKCEEVELSQYYNLLQDRYSEKTGKKDKDESGGKTHRTSNILYIIPMLILQHLAI